MPQYDFHHDAVKAALAKDGWHITHDPFAVKFEDVILLADLGAEKILAAEKGTRRIVVEIKSFSSASLFSDLQKAAGQYNMYVAFLSQTHPDHEVFMAISQSVYEKFFQRPSVRFFVTQQRIKLIIFTPETEEVVQWIS